MKTLVLNAGSSSYKLAIYHIEENPSNSSKEPIWHGYADLGQNKNSIKIHASLDNGIFVEHTSAINKPHDVLNHLLNTTISGTTKCLNFLSDIDVVGHRVVHGGSAFQQPILISNDVKIAIAKLLPLAPLHIPSNLQGIEIIEKLLPSTPQVAVFDTAFHCTIPPAACTYAGPYAWSEQGIKRYGFHGISHKYCAERCAEILKRDPRTLKIVNCHLGSGSSLAAIDKGKCIDTTMGFTPLEGMMMGTRCGSIDPGIPLFLQQEKKISTKDMFNILNFESGLKGISGTSADMRDIIRLAEQGNARSKLAYDMYVHSLKRNLGAMIAVLGGVDAVVFTAGIGENVPQIREDACRALQQFGLILDTEKNEKVRNDEIISSKNSLVNVLVIQTKEDWSIANSCWNIARQYQLAQKDKV